MISAHHTGALRFGDAPARSPIPPVDYAGMGIAWVRVREVRGDREGGIDGDWIARQRDVQHSWCEVLLRNEEGRVTRRLTADRPALGADRYIDPRAALDVEQSELLFVPVANVLDTDWHRACKRSGRRDVVIDLREAHREDGGRGRRWCPRVAQTCLSGAGHALDVHSSECDSRRAVNARGWIDRPDGDVASS